MNSVVTGGAGFIGSHLAEKLMQIGSVVVYDNLISGKIENIEKNINNKNFTFILGDVLDTEKLTKTFIGNDIVFHFAANSEVRTTATDLDLKQGIISTWSVLEAMRLSGIKKLIYASSSTVYGDCGAFICR